MIICASRRTDIPAFHSEWLMNRLREGYVLVRNPVQRNLVYRVDLRRSNVDCLVFVTKDPRPMVPKLKEIGSMGHMYVFQVTMTPYGRALEPGAPFKADVNDSCMEISDRIGRDRMVWRYDPVIISDGMGLDYHRRKFEMMCREASSWTDRCIFSFIDTYGKLRDLQESGIIRAVTRSEAEAFARMAAKVAEDHGMILSYCCPKFDLSHLGVSGRGCIDREMMRSLNIPYEAQSTPLREGCRCVRSVDIGEYDTCAHECLYCYANGRSRENRSAKLYDPTSEMLWSRLTPRDRIVELSSRDVSRIGDFL